MKKRLYFCLISVILSCGNPFRNPEGRQVFRYNESAGITSLDPAFARDQANIWAVNQLFNGLVQLDDQLKVKPCIAYSWDVSDDGRTYIFHLRNDVYFHDNEVFIYGKGRRVVAEDVVFSFIRLVSKELASPGAWVFQHVAQDPDYHFKALNDSTVEIRLKSAFPPFVSMLAMQYCSIIPREAVLKYGADFRKRPVGTGPFMLKYWKEGVKLVMIKNPNYFEFDGKKRLPYLDAVAVTFIADKHSAFLQFLKGNLDFLSGLDPSYKDELLTSDGQINPKYSGFITLSAQPYLNTEYLGFMVDPHLSKPNNPLLDKRIRQAINYGFDRRQMMRYLRNNIGTPGEFGMIPPGMQGFDSSVRYSYQPEKALRLLAEAGFPKGKGLPEITLSATASYLDLCKYIQARLADIGITLKIDVNPPATLREMVAHGKSTFFRASWIADYPDAENYLSLFKTDNFTPAGPNYTHFSLAEFDKLYQTSLQTINDSIRYNLYAKMDSIVMQQAPVVILYYDVVMRFSRKNISGLGNNPMNLLTLKRVKKSNLGKN